MVDLLEEQLQQIGVTLDRFRGEAVKLRATLKHAIERHQVSDESLIEVETASGRLYAEIAAFSKSVKALAETRPVAAAELAPVSDELRLLLLEITELGTQLYSVRNMDIIWATDIDPGAASD